jgi:prephenate dehydratase
MTALPVVGFQGERGAFSDQAIRALFGSAVAPHGYRDFDALVTAVDSGEIAYGLLPCENSIYGPIARAYDLLLRNERVAIVDETTHPIVQCLIGVSGTALQSVERVLSHPVALEQCWAFLQSLDGVKVEAVDDTAGAVRAIVERGDARVAAIGPDLAAQMYGGVVLAQGVQDDRDNATRFFVISRDRTPRRDLGRICIAFSLPHEPGSLYRALGGIADRGLNLRSLVARPQKNRPFEYCFVAELDCAADPDAQSLVPGAIDARVLGRF